ncbi:MAG: AbrB/MazE/SpoVT family DNA-binding domain-containing protein [Chloroflexi bacterium]|nr:AbrB/MazE/SpoVT family DNA-binding domain-containing protein [Chloroflexota bacterium]
MNRTLVPDLGEGGLFAIPPEVRDRYDIRPGDTFRAYEVDGVLVLMPEDEILPDPAEVIERARIEAGISMEEMFAGLREERERYVREKYSAW